MSKKGEIEYEDLRKLTDGFNDVDLRNVCTEAECLLLEPKGNLLFKKILWKFLEKLKKKNIWKDNNKCFIIFYNSIIYF